MHTTSSGLLRERETFLRERFGQFAVEQFPDNENNTWMIDDFEHRDDFAIVRATPTPDDVGYPSFKLMFHFDDATNSVNCVAVYCFQDGRYFILSSDPGPTMRLPREL